MKALGRALQVVFLPVAIVLALVILAIGYILWGNCEVEGK